uniref:Uncharacterized protein n=1 Tax=Globodera rostochiensis TaxID=31243 RepID=A0A914HMM7_GLORO
MEEFWILIIVSLLLTNSLDKTKSVKLKELQLQPFDEIFGEGWWNKGETEDLKTPPPTNFGQNVQHQIDRQNSQLGQIEPNSTDQLGQIEPNSTDQLGQIEPNSTDQNPSLTESDHSDNAKNGEEITSNEKRKIVDKFHAMKNEFKQIGKYSTKEWIQIEKEIAEHLYVNRTKIYKWKNEFGLSRKVFNEKEERKNLVEKFDQKKAELKRAGLKNAYHNEINEIVAKELGLSRHTLYRWKRQFKRQQFHQNSVDVGHSVEENAAANIQEIENSVRGALE